LEIPILLLSLVFQGLYHKEGAGKNLRTERAKPGESFPGTQSEGGTWLEYYIRANGSLGIGRHLPGVLSKSAIELRQDPGTGSVFKWQNARP
jgi:hypothetical protein